MYDITLCSVLIYHPHSNTTEREGLGDQTTSTWKQTDFSHSLSDTQLTTKCFYPLQSALKQDTGIVPKKKASR